jgi:hypothetical protein
MGRVAEVNVQVHTRREEAGMKFSGIDSHSLQGLPKKVGDDENAGPAESRLNGRLWLIGGVRRSQ